MKLVDILALDMSDWPQGFDRVHGCMWAYFSFVKYEETPWFNEAVTQDQWQAAVDALKAAEIAVPVPSDDSIEAWLVGLEVPYGLEAAQACRDIINAHKRKRDEAVEIQKIRDEIKWQKPQLGPCPVEQMYLLGYRKFEIVDN